MSVTEKLLKKRGGFVNLLFDKSASFAFRCSSFVHFLKLLSETQKRLLPHFSLFFIKGTAAHPITAIADDIIIWICIMSNVELSGVSKFDVEIPQLK